MFIIRSDQKAHKLTKKQVKRRNTTKIMMKKNKVRDLLFFYCYFILTLQFFDVIGVKHSTEACYLQ